MSKIVFAPPDLQTPGYLRHVRKALEFSEQLKSGATPAAVDRLVEFLLPYITEPVDRDQARDALWDATQAQFNELLQAVTGAGNPTSAEASDFASASI